MPKLPKDRIAVRDGVKVPLKLLPKNNGQWNRQKVATVSSYAVIQITIGGMTILFAHNLQQFSPVATISGLLVSVSLT
jgi:hypothetical protein